MTDKQVCRSDGWHYYLDNREVSEQEYRDRYPLPEPGDASFVANAGNAWPMKSEGAAVHPSQRAEAIADAEKKGVPTYFDRVGRPVFRSLQHQRNYLRAYRLHNRDDNM
jgi:hypothetical protein